MFAYGVTCFVFVFFKQKTAYERRISDWSSDVCSSDLVGPVQRREGGGQHGHQQCRAAQHGLARRTDRKSVVLGKSVSGRVDLGGRRAIKKQINTILYYKHTSLCNYKINLKLISADPTLTNHTITTINLHLKIVK